MILRIESADNGRLKLMRKLASRKTREAEGKFVIEGINLVKEAVSRGVDIDFIAVSDGFRDTEFTDECSERGLTVCIVPDSLFAKLTDAVNGVGIAAVVRKMRYSTNPLSELPDGVNVVVLDRLQDPGNIGTIVRTAVAAGYGMVIAIRGTVDVYSPKVLRSTAGAIFDIPVIYADNPTELTDELRNSGRKVIATSPTAERRYFDEDLSSNVAVVIGNEGNGISAEIRDGSDVLVSIPMKGSTESLNAAVSAALLMYEAARE